MIAKTHKPSLVLLHSHHRRRWAKQVTRKLAHIKPYLTTKNALIVGGTCLAVVTASYTASLFWSRTVALSYAEKTCFTNPLLLPNLVNKNKSASYQAVPVASLSIAGYPLYSHSTCLALAGAPKENATEAMTFGAGIFTKQLRVTTAAFPALANPAMFSAPLSIQDPLTLKLTAADRIFNYQILADGKKIACTKGARQIVCDVPQLNLAQSSKYDVTVQRLFGTADAGNLFSGAITTVEAVRIAGTSIAAGQTVFDAPGQLTVELSRPAVTLKGAHLYLLSGSDRLEVPITTSLKDQTLSILFSQPLARNASFELQLERLTAADGGFLATPFVLPFKTSGGPKVLGVNIGSYKVPIGTSVVITFDSPLSKSQNLADFVRLQINGQTIPATLGLDNRTIVLKPTANLPSCAPFTVSVSEGLQNDFGIAGGSAWQYKSRTICQSVFSIGTSVLGRGITAYAFGSGPSKIVFVGGTHGDEKSSTYTLNRWIDYLETNAPSIPANRTIIVIPNLNPDGFAASRRTNANNVDLNRNFPSNSWKQGVTMPDQSYNPNGGGSAPLSEPESSALAGYIQGLNPRLVLTYHAAAGIVVPNDAGDSRELALNYDKNSNLYFSNGGSSVFQYDTTGAFEDWLYDHLNIPALLVELWTKTGDEFNKNRPAMWFMTQLP